MNKLDNKDLNKEDTQNILDELEENIQNYERLIEEE